MANRGVGAAGAGCGAFGLLGLLVSVGIVVWLGSMSLGGGGGTGGGGRNASEQQALEMLGTTSAPNTGGVTVRIEPADGLGDDAPVHVTADGLPPNAAASIETCTAAALPGASEAGCVAGRVALAPTDAQGHLEADVVPTRVVTSGVGPIDCATAPGTCVLRVTAIDDPSRGGSAPLAYRTDLPRPELPLGDGS